MAFPASRASWASMKAPNARNALPPKSFIGHSLKGIHALIARKSENAITATGATRAPRIYRSINLFIEMSPLGRSFAGSRLPQTALVADGWQDISLHRD